MLGCGVVRPRVTETTALGAAYLAGLAVGYWSHPEEITTLWQAERTFEPSMPPDRVDAAITQWSRAVEAAQYWARR
jgi:glycerol kinase